MGRADVHYIGVFACHKLSAAGILIAAAIVLTPTGYNAIAADWSQGGAIFADHCARCHGSEGKGGWAVYPLRDHYWGCRAPNRFQRPRREGELVPTANWLA
jgi:hypothetical protein